VMMGHKAAYVQPLDRATISDVFELRGQIEPWAVASAVDNIGPQQILKIEMELNSSIEAVNRKDWLSAINAAREFHRLSYEPCGNKIARDVLDHLQEIMLFITVNLWSYKPTWQKETEEHGKIVEALKRKDRDLVRDVISRHIADARDNVMEMLEAREAPREMIGVEEEV
jgi:DNA-binding GntR family transcriptional regulator